MDIQTFDIDGMAAANTSIDDIETENITLVFLGVDQSGSMGGYTNEMKDCLVKYQNAITQSKQADEILIARANFDSSIDVGGYKPITEFETNFYARGMTSLYDVIIDGKDRLLQYTDYLRKQGIRVKSIFAIFSDGEDTSSRSSFSEAKRAIDELNKLEVTTAFVGFAGGRGVGQNLGFKNTLDVNGSEAELRKAFDCLSKSVISSSKSLAPDNDAFFQV